MTLGITLSSANVAALACAINSGDRAAQVRVITTTSVQVKTGTWSGGSLTGSDVASAVVIYGDI
jgi:hypothetical protein